MKKENLKLSFRKVTPHDVDAYLALEKTMIGPKAYSSVKDKEEVLQDFKDNEVYLIYKNGEIAGSAEFEMKSPDHAYMSGVVIHPDFQGQGIAREAVLFRLNKLKNVKRIDVITHPENSKIVNLYKSLGFSIEPGILENYYGDGEPRIKLSLNR